MRKETIALLVFFVLAALAIAVPSPHSIDGYIFTSTKQVVLGTDFTINDSSSTDFFRGKTRITVPGQSGRYFESINGSDGDTVIVTAWNITNYGRTSVMLNGTLKNVNVTLNITRDVEMNVTIIVPPNNSLFIRGSPFFLNASIHVLGNSGTLCTATLNFTNSSVVIPEIGDSAVHGLGSLSLDQILQTNWTLKGNATGSTNITVAGRCSESATNLENRASSLVANATISSVPEISLISPANNSNVSSSSVKFAFLPFDVSDITGCSLIINGSINQSNSSSILNDQHNNMTFLPGNGSWLWTVNCSNAEGRTGTNDSFTVLVDMQAPQVSLSAPADNSSFFPLNISFNYTASDNSAVANCSLFGNFSGNFVMNQSQHAPEGLQSFSPVSLGRGVYFWSVQCSDYAGNTAWSANRSLNVSGPDLEILPAYISFSNPSPLEGNEVYVNATVSNQGGTAASGFLVKFLANSSAGRHLANFTVSLLLPGQNITLNITYAARIGPNNIFVIADANDTVEELSEDNNEANNTFHVKGYSLYYGNTSATIVLATNVSVSLSSWQNVVGTGNLFAADKDSSIDFSSLRALGRNISNSTSNNDFAELDQILNMTYFNDSIFRMYTIEGSPVALRNFSTVSAPLYNVPVLNSTDNSTFVTGIVWDYSRDSGDGEYDAADREPVVFITALNASGNGRYGTYDFEILVPTNLRAYEILNVDSSLVFYTEII